MRPLAFSDGTTDALVFDLVQFEVLWKTDTRVVIPHITEVTAEHMCTICHLRLSAYAKQIFLWNILQILIDLHNLLEVLNRPNLQNSFREYFPNGDSLLERIKKVNELVIAILSNIDGVFDMLLQLF